MDLWHQFLFIAVAHFLALLSPGPDFFLIVRSAIVNGPRIAIGVCAGIAVANGVYIATAISGITLLTEADTLFGLLKWCGCAYLAWLGWQFLWTPHRSEHATGRPAGERSTFAREFRTGFASGILNPKNSLFYASLFSLGVDPHTPRSIQLVFGTWMFLAVFLWDMGVVRAAGHPGIVRRFMAHIHHIERATGAILIALAGGIAGTH